MITKIAWFMLQWLRCFVIVVGAVAVLFLGALVMIWISTHLGQFVVLFIILAVFSALMAGKVL